MAKKKAEPQFIQSYDSTIRQLELCGVIPTIKIEDKNKALPLGGALIAADMRVVEITFRTQHAVEAINTLTSKFKNILVGAGTVINTQQVTDAIAAGAKFIITPSFNPAVVDKCIELNIPVFPGCSSATDIEQAYSKGLRVVKFFPAELLGGVEMLKALSGPYPFMRFIPTGGINNTNLKKYLDFNKVLCCCGTYIAKENLLEEDNFEEIIKNAREAVEQVIDLQFDHVALYAGPDTSETIKQAFAQFNGLSYFREMKNVGGIEPLNKKYDHALGYMVYKSPNLERCIYYLGNRGFEIDKNTIVRNGQYIEEAFIKGNFGGLGIKLIRA